MSQSARDVQLTELKDMISQLNNTVNTQNKTMEAMTAMLAEKDQRIAELTEELRLLRKKIFGSSKERTGFQPTSIRSTCSQSSVSSRNLNSLRQSS